MASEPAPEPTGDPPVVLPADAPEDLRRAELALRAATSELLRLAEQIALWKALGTDTELHKRLEHSHVGLAAYQIYVALQNAIVLGIARMFDDDRRALDVAIPMNAIAEPANAEWLLNRHQAHFRQMQVHMVGGFAGDEQAQTDAVRMIREWSAQQAGAEFQQRMDSFKKAKKAFRSGEVNEALKRLKEMRRKEVAHTDLEPVWRTARPKVSDLNQVFDTVRELVWSANLLCTGVDHNDLRDLTRPEAIARCFTTVLRPETHDEHRAAAEAAQASAPGLEDYPWSQ